MNKENAHQLTKLFGHFADEYNENGLVKLIGNESLVGVYQSQAIDCLKLIKFLRAKKDNEATKAYHIGILKILLRLSHLRHNGKIETTSEKDLHIVESLKRWSESLKKH